MRPGGDGDTDEDDDQLDRAGPGGSSHRELVAGLRAHYRSQPPGRVMASHLAELHREQARQQGPLGGRLSRALVVGSVAVVSGLAVLFAVGTQRPVVVVTGDVAIEATTTSSPAGGLPTIRTLDAGDTGLRAATVTTPPPSAPAPPDPPDEAPAGPSTTATPITAEEAEAVSTTPPGRSTTDLTVAERPEAVSSTETSTEGTVVGSVARGPTVVLCGGRPATLVGTDGDDVLVGTDGNDVIAGGDGNDYIDGMGGDDTICGGNGKDELHGGAGDDHIEGGNGPDRLSGGPGDDELVGGNGRNVIVQ